MDQHPTGPEFSGLEDRAEQLIKQARLARQRGQGDIARKLLDEAAQIAPESATVLGALAEDSYQHKHFKTARDLFEKAKNLDPQNPHFERMFGECVLKVTEIENPYLFVESPESESAASGKMAVALSLFFPGIGQLVTGKTNLGAMMLGGWILGWTMALLIPNGMNGVFGLFGIKSQGSVTQFNALVLFPLALIAVVTMWSLLDAAQSVPKGPKRSIDRPVPPVDKPFEL